MTDDVFPSCEHVEIHVNAEPPPTSDPGWHWTYPRTPEGWQQWKDTVAPYGGVMPPPGIIAQGSKAWKAYADRQWEAYQASHNLKRNTES